MAGNPETAKKRGSGKFATRVFHWTINAVTGEVEIASKPTCPITNQELNGELFFR
jgi:hypothetical protein